MDARRGNHALDIVGKVSREIKYRSKNTEGKPATHPSDRCRFVGSIDVSIGENQGRGYSKHIESLLRSGGNTMLLNFVRNLERE